VALVIANSQASADSLIAAGFDPQRVVVIPNGIDPAPFDAAIADSDRLRRGLRQSLGLGEDEPLLGLFGRLSPWKGQHIAIESLESLPGVHLLLVGDALFGEEAYVERLRKLAARPGVEGRVHFLGFRDDVAGVMQGVDVVIHASTSPEPFGRVIVEAMLGARPVVATRGGGASEIIDEGKNGLLCDASSVKSLAEKVRWILAGGPQVEALVAQGGVSARERFAPGLILQQIETALLRLPKKG
jgi:glycosyltransferase involved in cell wall biosynthesis